MGEFTKVFDLLYEVSLLIVSHYFNLGSVNGTMGKLQVVHYYYKKFIKIYKKIQGEDHHSIANINLGMGFVIF